MESCLDEKFRSLSFQKEKFNYENVLLKFEFKRSVLTFSKYRLNIEKIAV